MQQGQLALFCCMENVQPRTVPSLTRREMAYLALTCRIPEPTRAEIAAKWGIAPKTVERHRANVYRKLEVHTRLEMLFSAVQLGLVPCPCRARSAPVLVAVQR